MSKSIYYINPMADFPTYFSAENYAARGFRRATQMADLAITTLAAMTPSDFNVRLCDENITPIDFGVDADFIGITGKITQYRHMVSTAREFRKRGKKVIIGGPYASLSPEVLRPHCDILVRGEIEELAPELFDDLRCSQWKEEYSGGRPDLSLSPIPRWDLYPNERAVMGTLQTSRGCPFECEFCDVIQYLGRKQRHKPPAQVLRELDVLYRHGYRSIFLADDNFTVFKSRAKDLLCAIRDWNLARQHGKVSFVTQISIEASKDDEMLSLCSQAGLTTVFIGIETPNEESLRETKKRQNLRMNLKDQVARFFEHGISVVGGMIVGFDADGPDIFGRQFEFGMQSGIPIFSLGALVAPAATPLHARMKEAGRLKEGGPEVAALPWATNIVPNKLTEPELIGGLQWLANNLYNPASFAERLLTFIDKFGERSDPRWVTGDDHEGFRSVDRDSLNILYKLRGLGAQELEMWSRIVQAGARKPAVMPFVMAACMQYMQIRYMYATGHFWDAQLTTMAVPPSVEKLSTLGIPIRSKPLAVTRADA